MRIAVSAIVLLITIGATALQVVAELVQSLPTEQTAQSLGFEPRHLALIDTQVESEIEKGDLPGCVILIGRREGIALAKAYGHRQVEPCTEEMTLDTVFDMASITKPVVTATSIMLLLERGQLRLGDAVATYIPEFGQNGKETITIEHLLTHQGGLVPDNPLEDYEHGTEEAWKRIWRLKPVEPVGTKLFTVMSDSLCWGK
jgi:CubicO group peptidase (beta-lactamase class C family)